MGKAPKQVNKEREVDLRLSDTPLPAVPGPEAPDNEPSEPSGEKASTVSEPRTRSHRRATGPRTAPGKQRSSLNAQKHGIFSKSLLVRNESPRDFSILLNGLREDFQPDGTLQTALVERLAMILWRQRRVTEAESAAIDEAIYFSDIDPAMTQIAEVWGCSRSGESAGGMLKHSDNPLVVLQAIEMLKSFRDRFNKFGFQDDCWLLKKLYGVDYNGGVPYGSLYHAYFQSKKAADSSTRNGGTDSGEDLKNKMLKKIDEEIERLKFIADGYTRLSIKRNQFKTAAALVPPLVVSERLLRYETHLSREFGRTLSLLERLQRTRLGQPITPSIGVQIT